MYVYVIFVLIVVVCVLVALVRIEYGLLKTMRARYDNAAQILFLMKKWDKREEKEKLFLQNYCTLVNYKNMAIYGYSVLGKRIVRNFENSNITVDYYIDKNAKNLHGEIPIFSMDETLPDVDVIIVTIVSQFYEIREELRKRISCNIISLEDLI